MMIRLLIAFGLVACGGPTLTPQALQGTDPDGGFHFDDQGQLVVDADAQRAFDYVLLAEGELDETELEGWLADRLTDAGQPEAEIDQIVEAFERYQQYRTEAAAVLEDPQTRPDLAQARLDEVRLRTLGDSPLARDEAARVFRAFALKAALDEPDPVVRQTRVHALTAPASAELRAGPGGRFLSARAAVEAAREAGRPDAELSAVRREAYASFGPEAVDRLEALQQQRANFRARVAALAAELDAMEGASEEAVARAMADNLEADFSEAEQKRVRGALDRYRAELR
ncbi:MAG: lipase secretion chaperone [Myxococcota bacterium]